MRSKLVEHDASNPGRRRSRGRKAAQRRRLTKRLRRSKAEAKAKLDKMLDQVEKLAD
ncbi:MAG: hypothetical protein ACLTYW_07025 [Collinsella sp.]